MRKAAFSGVIAVLAVCGSALAAAYRTGLYEAGAQTGFRHGGVRIDIHRGSFNVERILMPERCTAPGHPSKYDFGGFQQGPSATLRGRISAAGRLSGVFHDGQGGYTKVTGQIVGHDLTLTGHEMSQYVPTGSTVRYSCSAKGTFHPKRLTTGGGHQAAPL